MAEPAVVDRCALPQDVADCHALIATLLEQIGRLQQVTQKQQNQIEQLVRARFGQRSDRVDPRQIALFEMEQLAASAEASSSDPVEQPKQGINVGAHRRGHGRKALPKDLPRKRIVYEAASEQRQCGECGKEMACIGEDVSEQLEYQPASLYVIEHVHPKYACKPCDGPVVQSKKPSQPIEKGLPGAGLLAYVITSKYCDHLPLHRLEGILGRQGVEINRSTMCGWMRACRELLSPLYDVMKEEVLQSFVIQTDDTPVNVLDEEQTKARIGRIWTYVGDRDRPFTIFDYTPNRRRDGPVKFLGDFSRYLQADAYGGYDGIYADNNVREVACWAHSRRRFVDAQTSDPARALSAISRIRQLYKIEDEARQMAWSDRTRFRQERAAPILDEFGKWPLEQKKSVLPKSPTGEAVSYALSNWQALTRYAQDGRLSIDNNGAERALRSIAVGRANWLFFGSDDGGRTAAILCSIVASCKRHHVDPFAYLRDILSRISLHPAKHIRELLPDQWKIERDAARAAAVATAPTIPTP